MKVISLYDSSSVCLEEPRRGLFGVAKILVHSDFFIDSMRVARKLAEMANTGT